METKIIEIIERLLNDPMKALVVGSGIIAFFAVRKHSQLQDKTFKQFEDHRNDLKEAGVTFTNDMRNAKDDIIKIRNEMLIQTSSLREDILILCDRLIKYTSEVESTRDLSNKVLSLGNGLRETYGKVVYIEERLKASDTKLDKTREQLKDAILILQKHKEKISKL